MPESRTPTHNDAGTGSLRAPAAEHLVVQTAFLGDVLLGIPLFKALRDFSPTHRIVLLCRKGVGSFFVGVGLVDEVIEVDKSSKKSWRAAQDQLRTRHFDLLISPHESFRTARFVNRMNARLKIGYQRFFNWFVFDCRITRPMDVPEALRQLSLLSPIDTDWSKLIGDFRARQIKRGGQGVDGELIEVPEIASMAVPSLMAIRQAKAKRQDVRGLSSVIEPIAHTDDPIVVLAPGSVWPTKKWTKEGFIEVGRELSKSRGALVVIMGSQDEKSLCEEISAAIPNSVSIAGRTSLLESAQLLAVAELLICNDSGAMHLGAAAGVPIVSVFGPTVLEFGYRPWAEKARVAQIDLACRPCGKHGAKKCPLGTHACMKGVSAEQVLQNIARLTDSP